MWVTKKTVNFVISATNWRWLTVSFKDSHEEERIFFVLDFRICQWKSWRGFLTCCDGMPMRIGSINCAHDIFLNWRHMLDMIDLFCFSNFDGWPKDDGHEDGSDLVGRHLAISLQLQVFATSQRHQHHGRTFLVDAYILYYGSIFLCGCRERKKQKSGNWAWRCLFVCNCESCR